MKTAAYFLSSRVVARMVSFGSGVLLLFFFSLPAHASLSFQFINENTAYSDTDIYFVVTDNGTSTYDVTYLSGGNWITLAKNTDYSFHDVAAGGIRFTNITGGVIYVCLGEKMDRDWSSQPSFTDKNDTDYYKRWDKFEITFNSNAADVADLTGINSYAIPQKLTSYNGGTGGTQKQTLGYNVSGDQMKTYLGAITNNDPTAVLTDTRPGQNNAFLRVVGPTSFAAGTVGPYNDLTDYVNAVKSSVPIGDTVAKIVDSYSGPAGGTGPKASQAYNFTVKFDASGNLILTGTCGVQGATVITIPNSVTDPVAINNYVAYQIYAANPAYNIVSDGYSGPGNMSDNDVYAAAVRDILAGFAIGYVGSTVEDPNHPGVMLKDEESKQWWESGLAFSEVQPTNKYFNEYGEAFYLYSDSYGFSFSDRLPHKPVQVSLNPANVDTLTFTVAADSAVPEPSAFALLGLGLSAFGWRRLRRKPRE